MPDNIQLFTTGKWEDYELLDSGDEEKLERFGKYTFRRPEPKALWHKTLDSNIWNNATAVYQRNSSGGGQWTYQQKIDDQWLIHWKNLTFLIKPTGFKHMGFFPEQAAMWKWVTQKISSSGRPISLLNLFAYTGASTLAAAAAGASVTHIDSAKEILTWGRENATLSHLDKKPIRWIPEDVITFVKREIKRGNKYDAIIMDPPKFGRGINHEVWKIEENLPKLIDLCTQLLSDTPLFIIINAYAVSYSSITLGNILSNAIKTNEGKIISGELCIKHSSNDILLPTSIFSIWESI
jgi:23S rRNA (cytosine1962-C5)-methyltransferase